MTHNLLLFLTLVGLSTHLSAVEPKPNIVFILADDMGFYDVGFNGSTDFHTPNLDQLAKNGTVLTAMYGQPVCSPSRATLLTGRYPTHTGVYRTVGDQKSFNWPLPVNEQTLADGLRAIGYTTAICGKWHLGEGPEYLPLQRGFDHQYGHRTGSINSFTLQGQPSKKKRDWYRDDKPCSDEGYDTDLIAKEACRLIKAQPVDKPLFLYFASHAVHTPWLAREEDLAPYASLKGRLKDLAGMTAGLDRALGQILAALEAKGISKNTIIIFASDNGGPSWNGVSRNTPLRGGKAQIYEGGIRLCSFVTWPGKISAGVINNEPLNLVDWYPTLLKLAGSSADQNQNQNQKLPVDGLDIWPVLTQGAKSPHKDLLLMGSQPGEAAIRIGDWKLLVNPTDSKKAEKKSRSKSKSEVEVKVNGDLIELYNVVDDISEQNNLATAQQERVHVMLARLKELTANPANPNHFKDTK